MSVTEYNPPVQGDVRRSFGDALVALDSGVFLILRSQHWRWLYLVPLSSS